MSPRHEDNPTPWLGQGGASNRPALQRPRASTRYPARVWEPTGNGWASRPAMAADERDRSGTAAMLDWHMEPTPKSWTER